MDLLHYPLAFLVVLGVLVTFHEFGHYLVARWSGVQILRFSVGFGRPLWSYVDKRGTEFALAVIPLGGYVRMLDDRDPEQEELKRPDTLAYMDLTPQWRIAIALGGPVANFILAIVVYWALAVAGSVTYTPLVPAPAADTPIAAAGLDRPAALLKIDDTQVGSWQDAGMALTDRLGETGTIRFEVRELESGRERGLDVSIANWHEGVGEPDVFGSLGIDRKLLSAVGEVIEGSPAERAGLVTGDFVVAVDEQDVADWNALVEAIQARPATPTMLTVFRDGRQRQVAITPEARDLDDGTQVGSIGVAPPTTVMKRGPLEAIPAAMVETWDNSVMILSIVKKMIFGQVSVKNLSGPISIAQIAGDTARYSWRSFVGILAFLSVSFGVFNLLPIPLLDGGHVLFNSAELVTGKPVPERVQILGVQVGLFLVGTLMVFATYNDILRIF